MPTFADREPTPWWCQECGAEGEDVFNAAPDPCPECGRSDSTMPGPLPPEAAAYLRDLREARERGEDR